MKKLFLLFLISFSVGFASPAEDYNNALQSSGAQREQLLNKALAGFLKENNTMNIGNVFFELQQYPWAILYYARALKEDPDNVLAQKYLDLAITKLPIDSTFTLEARMSQKIIFYFFFLFLCLSFLTASIYIWFQHKLWLVPLAGFAVICLGFLFYATWNQYFTPLPAIMVKSSALYKGEGQKFGVVGDEPLFAGSSVQVVEVSEQSNWLKVETHDGFIGYLPIKSLRIL
ncbi:MAG: hypothetical protein K940chlam3_00473 [Chlamydiae bacterium]|nr:hypothetical protein [Chlamydiota bacterium]